MSLNPNKGNPQISNDSKPPMAVDDASQASSSTSSSFSYTGKDKKMGELSPTKAIKEQSNKPKVKQHRYPTDNQDGEQQEAENGEEYDQNMVNEAMNKEETEKKC